MSAEKSNKEKKKNQRWKAILAAVLIDKWSLGSQVQCYQNERSRNLTDLHFKCQKQKRKWGIMTHCPGNNGYVAFWNESLYTLVSIIFFPPWSGDSICHLRWQAFCCVIFPGVTDVWIGPQCVTPSRRLSAIDPQLLSHNCANWRRFETQSDHAEKDVEEERKWVSHPSVSDGWSDEKNGSYS